MIVDQIIFNGNLALKWSVTRQTEVINNHGCSKTGQYVYKMGQKIQKNREQEDLNGKLNDQDLKKYCFLDEKSKELLDKATKTYSLSFRSQNKVLKVARTIADLNKNKNIGLNDLFEALSFRYKTK